MEKYNDFEYAKPDNCTKPVFKLVNGDCYSEVFNLLDKRNSEYNFAVDIGGHIGAVSRMLSEKFKEVQTFEPLWVKYTRANLKDKRNVKVNAYGLGEADYTTTMNVHSYNSGASSMNRIKEREKHFIDTKLVNVKTLDSHNFTGVDFIKIDVETYELNVLKGAIETLKNNNPIIMIELLLREGGGKENQNQVYELLKGIGYSIHERVKNDYIFVRN